MRLKLEQNPSQPRLVGYAEKAAVGNGLLDPGMEVLTTPFAMDALSRKARALLDR